VNALRKVTLKLPYMDAAAANVGVSTFGPLPFAFQCVTAKLIPRRALTADDSNYGTVTVGFNDGAGGSVTTLQAITTKKSGSGGTGDWVAGTAIALSSIDRADVVTAATYLRAAVTKTGTGVVTDFVVVIDGYYEGA
jgi:hypothetical protein